jgi:hypothetical protein
MAEGGYQGFRFRCKHCGEIVDDVSAHRERGCRGKEAAVERPERKMPEGLMTGAELEARVRALALAEAGPLAQEVATLKHDQANLRAMIEAVDRKVEGFGKLVERVPPSVAAEGEGGGGLVAAPSSSPLKPPVQAGGKPWEAEGMSKSGWYKRKKKEAGHGRLETGEVACPRESGGLEAEGS